MANEGYNHVTLFGQLADPEFKVSSTGTNVLKLRMATNESYLDKNRERQERTSWHNVVVFGRRAESLSRILRRGETVLVDGSLRTRSYDKNGEKRYVTEVVANDVFLCGGGGNKSGSQHQQRSLQPQQPSGGDSGSGGGGGYADENDDIPFLCQLPTMHWDQP